MTSVPLRPSMLEVDLDAAAHNVRAVRQLVGPERKVFAVVKELTPRERFAERAPFPVTAPIPATYLVPAGSPIRSVAEVDREGVRMAVPEQSAYGLFLSRSIKHARLVLTKSPDAAFAVFVADKLEAMAGLRQRLLTDVRNRARVDRSVHCG